MTKASPQGRVALARAWALAVPGAIALLAAGCGDSLGPDLPPGPAPAADESAIGGAASSTGSLRIITSTAGVDLDPNGYAAVVDGGSRYPIDLNDTVVVTGLAPGAHSVSLDNVSLNCRGSTSLTRSVTIQAATTTSVTFAFTCTTQTITTGTLQVVTATTGSNLDPDGYSYSVDSAAVRPIGLNTTVTVGKFKVSQHSVRLGNIASNCTVDGGNPVLVDVTANATVQAAFSVTCSGSSSGSIAATVSTSGANLDPDGYSLAVDGGPSQRVGLSGSATFSSLAPGSHTVLLGDVANNCSVNGPNPQTVSVAAGQTNQVALAVACTTALRNQIVFLSARDAGSTTEIYFMNADGTNIKRLTRNTADEDDPFPSPDGSKILFQSTQSGNNDIFVMKADGSGIVNLTRNPASDTDCNWTPDGSKIAFESNRSGDLEIWEMSADGSGLVQLTTAKLDDGSPTFSPDGSKIALEAHRDGNAEIYRMNADGSNAVNLTNNPAMDGDPAWSTDGSRIAFTTRRYRSTPEIVTMGPDGSSLTRLTNNTTFDQVPTWSPDGSKIVFQSNRSGNYEVWVMNANGTAPVRLTNNSAFDGHPAWAGGASGALFASGP